MKKSLVICFALLAVIALSPAYSQQARSYTEADDTIKIAAGQNIVITLEANQTTGFKWELAEPLDKGMLELVNVEYVLGMARFLGAGGKEVWTLKALAPGEASILLKYVRPWEKNIPPAKEKKFKVTINAYPVLNSTLQN
jgi:predicted secreted protein